MPLKIIIYNIIVLIVLIVNSCTVSWNKAIRYGDIKQEEFYETLDIEIKNNLVFVPVQINGITYRFLFDTGAMFSISKEIQEELKFKVVSKGNLVDSDKNRSKVSYVRVDDLQIGKINFENQTAFVANFKANPILECMEIDGIVGSNLMRHCIWTVDQQNQKLSFGTYLKPEYIKDAEQVPFKTDNQYDILLNIEIGKATLKNIKLDYGSNGPLSISKSNWDVLKENDIIQNSIVERGIKNSGIFGKPVKISRETTFTDSLKMNDFYIENVQIRTGTSRLFGNKILSKYTVSIDYKNKKLFFQKNDSISTTNWTYGFKVGYNSSKGIVINSVTENSKAFEEGILTNMKVAKIDSLNFELGNDFCDYVDFMQDPPEVLYIQLIDSVGEKVDFNIQRTDLKKIFLN